MKYYLTGLIFLVLSNSLFAQRIGQGDSCANGVLICNNTCLNPGAPGYDEKYISICDGTTWDGTGPALTAPQLPAACSVPPTGGTINCAGAACIAAAAAITRVKAKTTNTTPALPYVQFVRTGNDVLNCQLVYDAGCAIKSVPSSMCKKAGAMIPPKAQTQPVLNSQTQNAN